MRTNLPILVLLVSMWATPALAGTPHYALVIGHNDSTDPELAALRYADDDAIRYHELFRLLSPEATLLTNPDEETQRLYPAVRPQTPTRARVLQEMRTIRDAIAKDVARGEKPVFTLVFSGHGSYDAEGRGFLYLADGVFTTLDLYDEVIAPNTEANVVLVIDACNAALLVHSRGPGGGVSRVASAPSRLKLEAYPHVGVILSSSSVGEVHEWGRYLSGVFSHEVRSALLGPGDLDGDRKITFPELASFVAAANEAVDNPTIRLKPYIRPPINDPDMALIDLDATPFPARITVESTDTFRGYIMDSRLIRYLDVHMAGNTSFEVGLVTNERSWIVIQEDREWQIPEGSQGNLSLKQIPSQTLTKVATRGATSAYFDETLFQEPFSRDFASGYLTNDYPESLTVERIELSPWYESGWGWGLSGVALGTLSAGIFLHAEALSAQDRAYEAIYTQDREDANQDIYRSQMGMGVLYGVGGAALTGAVLSFIFDRDETLDVYQPPFSVNLGPNGLSIEGSLP